MIHLARSSFGPIATTFIRWMKDESVWKIFFFLISLQYVNVTIVQLTSASDAINRCKLRRIDTEPRNRSSGESSGPGISLLGCGQSRQIISRASTVIFVGYAPAHDRFGNTRAVCGVFGANLQMVHKYSYSSYISEELSFSCFLFWEIILNPIHLESVVYARDFDRVVVMVWAMASLANW